MVASLPRLDLTPFRRILHALVVTTGLVLLFAMLAGASAQDLSFVDGPKILSVTPRDSGAQIAFIPPTATATTPEILEYNVECRVPDDNMMGISVFTLSGTSKSAELYGLENGVEYICDIAARGATEGLLPRAINSPVSNPTPAFTPMSTMQPTIFVDGPQEAKPEDAALPPTVIDDVVLPRAPTIRDIEMVAAGQAEINFSLPAGDETSPVSSFIAACQHNGDAGSSTQATAPAGSTKVVVTGLNKAGEWTCSVVAQTADGIGQSATRVVEVEEDGTVEAQDGPATTAAVSLFTGVAVLASLAISALAL